MEITEAKGKLAHYLDTYGDWLLKQTPEGMLAKAQALRDEVAQEQVESGADQTHLKRLVRATQFESVAECLRVCGKDLPDPRNVVQFADFQKEQVVEVDLQDEEDAVPVTVVEAEDLQRNIRRPLFNIGETVWIEGLIGDDPDPNTAQVGYMEAVIAAIDWRHDSIRYRIGLEAGLNLLYIDESLIDESDVYREVPDKPRPRQPVNRPRLQVVK